MKKIIDELAFFIGILIPFAIIFLFFMVLIKSSEDRNNECIENGGKVIDDYSVFDSCIYGG